MIADVVRDKTRHFEVQKLASGLQSTNKSVSQYQLDKRQLQEIEKKIAVT